MTQSQEASPEIAAASEVRAGAPERSVRKAVSAAGSFDVANPNVYTPRAVPGRGVRVLGRPLASRGWGAPIPPSRSSRRDFTLSSQEVPHV
jgi:hypothetical protein